MYQRLHLKFRIFFEISEGIVRPTIGKNIYLKHCMTKLSSSFDLIESLLCVGTWKFSSIVFSTRHLLSVWICLCTWVFTCWRACVCALAKIRQGSQLSLSAQKPVLNGGPPVWRSDPYRLHSFFIHASLLSILSRTYSYTLRLLHKMSAPPVTVPLFLSPSLCVVGLLTGFEKLSHGWPAGLPQVPHPVFSSALPHPFFLLGL